MRTNLNELKDFLDKEFSKKVSFNSSYSKRAFARDLGISPSVLSEFQSGKRELSFQNIDKIFKYINSKIHCSWCDKQQKEVELLVGGPRRQFICNECISECNRLVKNGIQMENVK